MNDDRTKNKLVPLLEALAPKVVAIKQHAQCVTLKLVDGRWIEFSAIETSFGAEIAFSISEDNWDVTMDDLEDDNIPF